MVQRGVRAAAWFALADFTHGRLETIAFSLGRITVLAKTEVAWLATNGRGPPFAEHAPGAPAVFE
jgi:hypothetical protein